MSSYLDFLELIRNKKLFKFLFIQYSKLYDIYDMFDNDFMN